MIVMHGLRHDATVPIDWDGSTTSITSGCASLLDVAMSAGEHFRELLRARGLRELDVAEGIGVHKNTVSNWATGRTPVVSPRVRDLAALLGTSIDELASDAGARVSTAAQPDDLLEAVEVLQRLLDSAGALRSMSNAAPRLMDVLRDAELAVERHTKDRARGPRST
jgi:transcriptional regulator with XRE-family HTH domain